MVEKILFLAIFLIAAVCNNQEFVSQLSKENQNQQVKIKNQQEFSVTLPANPTTGYRWTLADSQLVNIHQVGTATYKGYSQKLGSGGDQIFRFKASQPGKTTLKLIYHRSWEKNVAPIDSFVVSIDVVK